MTGYVGKISSATLLSRILGYIRDMLIANMFGATLAADAFYVAYRIPNLLRRLLGENSLSSSFIPVFTQYLTNKSKKESQQLVSVVVTVLLLVLSVLTVAGIIFAPLLVRLIAPGFAKDPQKLALTIQLTRIMFPFMIAIGLAALSMGILNSLHKFVIPALAPCFLSISGIFFVLTICPLMETPIKGLAIGVLIGGFGQLIFQIPSVIKNNFWVKLKLDLSHPGLRRIGFLMVPAIIGLSVNQINIFVDTICASLLKEGSITALYYANRLVQFPLALFGTAIATVTLPILSRSIAENNLKEMKTTLSLSLRMVIFTMIPSSIGLIVLGKPIIMVLFQRGEFSSQATMMTSSALFFYSLGLFADASVKIVVSAFYSFQDTRTPVKTASICMIINIVLDIILMRTLQVGGLALATAIASFVNIFLLFILLRKRIGQLGGKEIIKCFIKTAIAGIIMGIACYFVAFFLFENKYLKVSISLLVSIMVFIAAAHILKIKEMESVLKLFAKKGSIDSD